MNWMSGSSSMENVRGTRMGDHWGGATRHKHTASPAELDAEANFDCWYCKAKAGEPCLYLFKVEMPKFKYIREFRQSQGLGRWVHQMRMDRRNAAREEKEPAEDTGRGSDIRIHAGAVYDCVFGTGSDRPSS